MTFAPYKKREGARAATLGVRHTKKVRLALVVDYPEDVDRPKTRGECAGGARPCPFVSCRHHLYLDTNAAGGLKLNHPELEPDELWKTCSLDVADEGSTKLEHVGVMMNLTRERVRQIEDQALQKLSMVRTMREFK